MWKPGSRKPERGPMAAEAAEATATNRKNLPSFKDDDNDKEKTSPRKRLSGATLNMKFMKRKKEISSHEQQQQLQQRPKNPPAVQKTEQECLATTSSTKNGNNDQYMHFDDIDNDDNNDETTMTSGDGDRGGCEYEYTTTSVEMYGMEAALIGRRSFRGFNPTMERTWADSKKASLETGEHLDGRPTQKLSDEELLRRYQQVVNERDAKSRTVGNLEAKMKKRKR
mmetsp:Transcript_20843/g.36641  ORF Transcript_20843/g.36641 Transcript_20843/m.36641 type:complete len:225 (-) Transcript_20843:503-1177(-)